MNPRCSPTHVLELMHYDWQSDWCKILVVHQNRDLGVGRKNSLKEEYIPSFFVRQVALCPFRRLAT